MTGSDPPRKTFLRAQLPDGALDDLVDSFVRSEDERMWAFYREPESSLSQMEACRRALKWDYPEDARPSQSTVSRRLSTLDKEILTEPIELLNMSDGVGSVGPAGFMDTDEYHDLKRNGFSDYLDVFRETIAGFLVDREALLVFGDGSRPTPAWAQRRFANLDPDLGRAHYRQSGRLERDEVHASSREVPGDD